MNESPRILVSAGSKHGATTEIAENIGETLISRGLTVTVAEPNEVSSLDGYEGIVLGSAIYAGHWVDAAKSLAHRVPDASPRPKVWIFSSGPVGDPLKPEEAPVDVPEMSTLTSAVDHRVFAGKIDKSLLGFGEKAVVVALRAPEGDFRNWDEIAVWANGIADTLLG